MTPSKTIAVRFNPKNKGIANIDALKSPLLPQVISPRSGLQNTGNTQRKPPRGNNSTYSNNSGHNSYSPREMVETVSQSSKAYSSVQTPHSMYLPKERNSTSALNIIEEGGPQQ